METTNTNIIVGTAENFQTDVIDVSSSKLVMVDIWADWCEPCKTLMPILEKLAAEFSSQLLLVKVNADEQQALAGQLGVQSLPTVLLLKDGQVVDHFMGVLAESEIRTKITPHLPELILSPGESIEQALTARNFELALGLIQQQLAEKPEDTQLKLQLVRVQMQMGQAEAASELLDSLPLETRESMEGQALAGALEFSLALADAPTIEQLQENLDNNPDDHKSRYLLAAHTIVSGAYAIGIELLLELLQRDKSYQDGLAQRSLVAAFELANDPQLVRKMRSKMARLLN